MPVNDIATHETDGCEGLDERAALSLLTQLKAIGYRFITPTPATHHRVLERRGKALAASVRDVLGWSLPFAPEVMPPAVFAALSAARAVTRDAQGLRATIRVSSLGEDLFIHSAFPPKAEDAVFFGPDTYRFTRFLDAHLRNGPAVDTLIDIGSGSGVGVVIAARATRIQSVVATDINRAALTASSINLAAAGIEAEVRLSDGLANAPHAADLIIANPPFIAGDGGRTYRDGGDMHGARLSLDWAMAGAPRLTPNGRLLLYTGAAIVDGVDPLRAALLEGLDPARYALNYQELDPDIFGEMLQSHAYRDVERIAAIGAVISRRP